MYCYVNVAIHTVIIMIFWDFDLHVQNIFSAAIRFYWYSLICLYIEQGNVHTGVRIVDRVVEMLKNET